MVTDSHVLASWRLVDITLLIKETFRLPIRADVVLSQPPALPSQISCPLRGEFQQRFAAPPNTQEQLGSGLSDDAAGLGDAGGSEPHVAEAAAPEQGREGPTLSTPVGGAADETRPEGLQALKYEDLPSKAEADGIGLGVDGAMLFGNQPDGEQLFKDRVFVRKLLLSGRDGGFVSRLVDSTTLTRPGVPAAADSRKRKAQRVRALSGVGVHGCTRSVRGEA